VIKVVYRVEKLVGGCDCWFWRGRRKMKGGAYWFVVCSLVIVYLYRENKMNGGWWSNGEGREREELVEWKNCLLATICLGIEVV
jgi:hypothetical protein